MDLTQPHAADERPCIKGGWVLSLEVAEHIPPQFTDSYIRNIRCSCRIGAVLSWAHPSQTGGLGHVNTKHQKDAIEAMTRWGFYVDEEATKAARPKKLQVWGTLKQTQLFTRSKPINENWYLGSIFLLSSHF